VHVVLVWDYVTSLNIPDLADRLPQPSDMVRFVRLSMLHFVLFLYNWIYFVTDNG